MNVKSEVVKVFNTKEICTVVVVYEDAVTRERALTACGYLKQQFWPEVEFDFHWWRADFLEHRVMARAAAEQAVAADFLIFSSNAERELSSALKAWFESWVGRRHGRDGALLNLTTTGSAPTRGARETENFLREVAHCAMFDYFASVPQTITGALASSFEDLDWRAGQRSSVLDEILHQSPRPPGFGLND